MSRSMKMPMRSQVIKIYYVNKQIILENLQPEADLLDPDDRVPVRHREHALMHLLDGDERALLLGVPFAPALPEGRGRRGRGPRRQGGWTRERFYGTTRAYRGRRPRRHRRQRSPS